MKFHSTRSSQELRSISDCIVEGLAPDGGLYMPQSLPEMDLNSFNTGQSFAEFATKFMEPFFAGDELFHELPTLCEGAFNFPLPISEIDEKRELLELYHGPTCAFKDFGARFLAECLQKYNEKHQDKKMLVLVATSGDTGGAVASAFYKKKNCQVGLLFPLGGVSERQKAQLTGWGDNIQSFEVKGVFDDCQKLVKEAFHSDELKSHFALTSANSINMARLLPQASYFAYASFHYFRTYNQLPSFYVPTGNMGNVFGAYLAKACGFPINKIHIATNANASISEYFKSGKYQARPSVKTLANAMDVGAPSNMERLQWLHPDHTELLEFSQATLVNDENIKETITEVFQKYHKAICPHTATAFYAWQQHPLEDAILVSTAHPAKFDDIVEPLIGQKVEVPQPLQEFFKRGEDHQVLEADLTKLVADLCK